jgi:hypothetical protein
MRKKLSKNNIKNVLKRGIFLTSFNVLLPPGEELLYMFAITAEGGPQKYLLKIRYMRVLSTRMYLDHTHGLFIT